MDYIIVIDLGNGEGKIVGQLWVNYIRRERKAVSWNNGVCRDVVPQAGRQASFLAGDRRPNKERKEK